VPWTVWKLCVAIPICFWLLAHWSRRAASGYNTPTEFVINLEFDNGSVLSVHNHYRRDDGTEFENGILFEGENGRIFVNRGKFTGKPLEDLTEADNMDIEERMVELYKGKQPGDHMRNFFECVEERVQPVSDVATHHRTMTSCHLCNIALWLGRDLHWDPEAEHFISDDQANALMTRKSRDGFV
jgi:myo-inositol 2-dehydrogenase/D-chiro-inositol 1-dehydrogenase